METNHTDDTGQLARDGDYFLKRDRNKARTLGIYTCKKVIRDGRSSNQTVRVASTDTSDFALAEIALKRFVLTSKEALQKERANKHKAPSQAIDRPVMDALNMYYLGHAEKKNADFARGVRSAMRTVQDAWPDNPMCSTLDRDKQLDFVAYCRETGLRDNTIATRHSFIWSAMRWCDAGGKLAKFPGKIQNEEWEADRSSNRVPYTLDELATLFTLARRNPAHWRYMVCAIGTASRPTALIKMMYKQFDGARELCHLNPEGRRQTKKRRPIVRMCRTFVNEMKSWPRTYQADELVVGLDSVKFFRDVLSRDAGFQNSFPMRIRHTVRTWMAERDVLDAKADILMGHAEEGSATGRRFYKHLKPGYQAEAAAAIEELFMEIAARAGPFAGMSRRPLLAFKLDDIVAKWSAGAANEGAFVTQALQVRDEPSCNLLNLEEHFQFSGNNVHTES